ncbi:hypothetical protein HIMB5_00011890 [alpha proteobacterium HIMB5]|nr:hypothetical protein HIMB5_00011890 [alpha proteobacterium HIMB5]
MDRFKYLKGFKDDEKFIGMKDIYDEFKFNKNSPTKVFSPIEDIMDIFYISLLIGLTKNKKVNFNDANYIKGDMTPNWTGGLNQTKELIISLYVSQIIKEKDPNYNDKEQIQFTLNSKLGTNPTRSLSDEGMNDIHNYAFGGYIELMKQLGNKKPNDLLSLFSDINELLTN